MSDISFRIVLSDIRSGILEHAYQNQQLLYMIMIFCTERCMKLLSGIVHSYVTKYSRQIRCYFESCFQLTSAAISTYSYKFWDITSIKVTIADLNQTRYFLQILDNYVVIFYINILYVYLFVSFFTHTNICNILGKFFIIMILNPSVLNILMKYCFQNRIT